MTGAILANIARARAMYAGINYFFRPDSMDEGSYAKLDVQTLCRKTFATLISSEPTLSKTRINIVGTAEIDGVLSQITLVIQNLLSNAVKFTKHIDKPEITVLLKHSPYVELQKTYSEELAGYDGRGMWAELHVKDNGPGIDPELKNAIFQLYFTRIPIAGENIPKGTGMGLAIARLATLMHRGLIFLASGQSADFVVLLPVTRSDGISLKLLVARELPRSEIAHN
jgi:signal transduction histidine kinase